MENQNKKIIRWTIGLGVSMIILILPELLIVKSIYPDDVEAFKTCMVNILLITLFAYLIMFIIKFVQYTKFANEYKRNKIEEANKELTSEFKKVFIRSSGDISKDMFECKAKVDEDGKIICEVFLNMKTTFDSYEKFLEYFCFNQQD